MNEYQKNKKGYEWQQDNDWTTINEYIYEWMKWEKIRYET